MALKFLFSIRLKSPADVAKTARVKELDTPTGSESTPTRRGRTLLKDILIFRAWLFGRAHNGSDATGM